jgi:hypothetical protein
MKTTQDYLAEAEEAARTKTPKKGICSGCRKSYIELDAKGRRYIWCKKCTAIMKKELSGLDKIGLIVDFGPSTLTEQRRLYRKK